MANALLLELEGVLVETERLWRDALVAAMATHGLEGSVESVMSTRAVGVRERVERALRGGAGEGDETLVDLLVMTASREFATRLARGVTLAPGAAELVERARSSARVAVVTRSTRPHAEAMLAMAGLEEFVEFVIAHEDAPAKPSPAPYERAVERLGRRRAVTKDGVLALEDGPGGARAARLASLACVVVSASPEDGAVADAWVPSLEGHDVASLDRLVSRTRERAG